MKRFEKYYGWIIAFVFCVAVIAVYKTFDNFNNITQYLAKIFDAVKPFFIALRISSTYPQNVCKNGFLNRKSHL